MFRFGIVSVADDGLRRVVVRFICGCWRTFRRAIDGSGCVVAGFTDHWKPDADGPCVTCTPHAMIASLVDDAIASCSFAMRGILISEVPTIADEAPRGIPGAYHGVRILAGSWLAAGGCLVDNPPDPTPWIRSVFASEDALQAFVAGLDDRQAAALDAMLYARGVRYDPNALRRWRQPEAR